MGYSLSNKKLSFWSQSITAKARDSLIEDMSGILGKDATDAVKQSAKSITEENDLLGEIWRAVPSVLKRKVRINVIAGVSGSHAYFLQFPDLAENIGYTLLKGQTSDEVRRLRAQQIQDYAHEVLDFNAEALLKAAIIAVYECKGIKANAELVKHTITRLKARGVDIGDTHFTNAVVDSGAVRGTYVVSDFSRQVSSGEREALFDDFQALKDSLELLAATKNRVRDDEVVDPMEIRRRALEAAVPSHRLRELQRMARTVISQNGGSSYFRVYPDLAGAIVYEAIKVKRAVELEDLEAEDARGPVEQFFRNAKTTLYLDEMQRTLDAADVQVAEPRLRAVHDLLVRQRITLGAFNFEQRLFAALQQQAVLEDYEPLFSDSRLDVNPAPSEDFVQSLDPALKRSAIAILQNLGVKPTTRDQDWARVALALAGTGGMGGGGNGFGVRTPGVPLKFRRFEDEQTSGLNSERIRVISDLYYIDQFDRLGVFEVVEELGLGMMQRKYDFGGTEVATEVALYTDNLRFQFSTEDRREMLATIFETSNFRALVGRFVNAMLEYARIRNAGELVTSTRPETTVYTRAAVVRTMLNLQRFLSDAGGGFLPYLRDKLHAQLESCFDILERSDVQQRWEGISRSGMWAVVDGVIFEKTQSVPPTDRYRTLAVSGRDWLNWVAENTSTVETITDAEVDVGAELIQSWYSVYPREGPEAEWVDDEDYWAGEEDEDMEDMEGVAGRMEDEAMRDAMDDDVQADVL